MDIYLIIAVAGLLCCLVLGTYALTQDRGKTLNRLFFLMSLSLAGFIFSLNMCFSAESMEILLIRYKISSLFFSSYFALNLHFNIVFTRHRLKRWQTALLYLPVPVVILTTLTGRSLFANFTYTGYGWNFVPAYSSFHFYFFLAYVISYMILSIILMELYRRRTELNKGKQQAKIINTAYFITMILSAMCGFFFPLFNIYWLSQLGPNTYLIYYLAIFYSVFRLKFMNLTPSIMADEIIEHIGEMILLLGNDCRIIMGNSRSLELLKLHQEDLRNKSFFKIIRNRRGIKDKIRNYLKSNEKSMGIRVDYPANGNDILTDTYISRIYDKFNDLAGFLVISKENKGKPEIQKRYGITEREFDVIELLLSGLSNKLIGKQLDITVRTVESHCQHIYSKLGVKDRIELFTFAGEFNLLSK
jgi:DNA-binding CsgD family transcriptional regulator